MKYYKFKVAKINAGTPSHYIARFESAENGIEVFEAENTFKDFSVVSISDDNKATEIINSQDSNLGLVEIELDEFTTLKESSYTYKLIQENLQYKNFRHSELKSIQFVCDKQHLSPLFSNPSHLKIQNQTSK